MLNLSLRQALSLWTELEQCYYKANGYGTDTADPEQWLGAENDPSNPQYQELRRGWKKVIEKVLNEPIS